MLSLLGLAAGVLTLNAVLSVMNGFQMTYIDSLVEVSSSHLRWLPVADEPDSIEVSTLLSRVPGVVSVLEESESQTLVQSDAGRQRGALVRGLPSDALQKDPGLRTHLKWQEGGLPQRGEVALGSALAASLGAFPGSSVKLTSLSGPSFSLLEPRVLEYRVVGVFGTGYYDLDANWVIANLSDAKVDLAGATDRYFAVKLNHPEDASWMLASLARASGRPEAEFRTWEDFNRAFFQALRTEKSAMMLLVGLMFLVVGVNIAFSQKRAVLEHRDDLALLVATGTTAARLRWVFALEGLIVGLAAALLGTFAGWGVSLGVSSLGLFSSEAFYIPEVPARMIAGEVVGIALACLASATLAAWWASGQVLKVQPGEVLKNA
ncbi:MAG: FtsX-like permease family protein [Spirochaetales bacterium]